MIQNVVTKAWLTLETVQSGDTETGTGVSTSDVAGEPACHGTREWMWRPRIYPQPEVFEF